MMSIIPSYCHIYWESYKKKLSLSADGGCQGQQEEHSQGYATKPIEILHCHLHYNRYPLMAATHTWIA